MAQHLTKAQIQQIRDLRSQGHTGSAIAIQMGIKRGTVYSHLDKTLFYTRTKPAVHHTEEEKAVWVELYLSGKCSREIAVECGVVEGTVGDHMKRLGIRRTKSQARLKNRHIPKEQRHKHAKLKCYYGIGWDDLQRITLDQGGACLICKRVPKGTKADELVVDHDHQTGVFRGVICWHCNQALGHAKDSVNVLFAAQKYLITHFGVIRPKKVIQPTRIDFPIMPLGPKGKQRSDSEKAQWVELYVSGIAAHTIGRQFGVSHKPITAHMKKLGILRTEAEAHALKRRYTDLSPRDKKRHVKLLQRYGIELSDFNDMVAQQDGKCAICQTTPQGNGINGTLHVDHDHSTGSVRALLCHFCNNLLGSLKDSPDLCLAAAEYLKQHSGSEPTQEPLAQAA